MVMNKSDLIHLLQQRHPQLPPKDVDTAVRGLIDHLAETLMAGGRIELRGFGSFSLHYRAPRTGRNPQTGASVEVAAHYVPHFKPGRDLRERVNEPVSESA